MAPPTVAAPAAAPAGLERTTLVTPRTVDAACAELADARARGQTAVVLAGGTDWMELRARAPLHEARAVDRVVDVTSLPELLQVYAHVSDGEARLTLGGGVTYWMLRTDPRILTVIPMLGAMARDVGAVQVQTRGTLAGNIATASPAADGAAALMALDAMVTLRSAEGTRTLPLASFFTGPRTTALGPAELIVALDLRVPRAGARVHWRKVGARLAQAVSKVSLAAVVETDDRGTVTRARFGMASVAPVITSLPTAQRYLEGRALAALVREGVDGALAADIAPESDVRSTASYRAHVARALLWRALSDD